MSRHEYIKTGSPQIIIKQYEELLEKRISELQEIMQETGIKIRIKPLHKKAA